MKPFETLDAFTTPDGRRLTLHRRDGDHFVYLDGDELMSTRAPGSENALAELACRGLRPGARVLIGGLGLGFTLRAALDVLPERAEVVVAEVFASVIRWNRELLPELQGDALRDPRTRIVEGDVWNVLVDSPPWDAVLLDVDNGPDAWCLDSNARLYDERGLRRLRQALAPGGTLAFWSARPAPRFLERLRRGGFDAESRLAKGRGRKGARHTIFLARPLARA